MTTITRPKGATRNKKRLGRGPGSGHGTTAGKGTKGQNSRSGGGVRLGFEGGQMPLYRRVASRGFSNYPFKREFTGVNVSTLEKKFKSGSTVTLDALREKGIVSASEKDVKLLGNGELTKKLKVEGLKVSRGAREKILAAGGSIDGEVAEKKAKTAAADAATDVAAAEDAVAEDAVAEEIAAGESSKSSPKKVSDSAGTEGSAKKSTEKKPAAKKAADDGAKKAATAKKPATRKPAAKKTTTAKSDAATKSSEKKSSEKKSAAKKEDE